MGEKFYKAAHAFACVTAIVWRMAMYRHFQPLGIETDGLGLAHLFWHPDDFAARLPQWWRMIQDGVGGNWPPGYSLFIALTGRLTLDPLLAGRWVSAFASGCVALIVAGATRRLTDSRSAGILAALLMAFAPLAVAWDVRVRPESLFQVFFMASIAAAFAFFSSRRKSALAVQLVTGGLACCVKYDGFLLIPGLLFCCALHVRDRGVRSLMSLWPTLFGFAIALAWMLTRQGNRAGYYGEFPIGHFIRQASRWIPLTLSAWPTAITWPVAVMAVWGCVSLFRQRSLRMSAWYSVSLLAFCIFAIGINRDWNARHLLITLPMAVVLASVGFAAVPRFFVAKCLVGIVLVFFSGLTSWSWVECEKDMWRETIKMGRTVARIHAQDPEAVLWTDDFYLTPFWAGYDMRPLVSIDDVSPGEYVLLHDVFGALNRKMLVHDSLSRLGSYQLVAGCSSAFQPIAGGLFDPAELATSQNLADVGPRVFWKRNDTVIVDSVIVRRANRP